MIDLALAERVSYQDVKDYLRSRGWTAQHSKRDYVAIYRHTDPIAEVQVPLDRSLQDYADSIFAAARRVSEVERRPADAVVRDLLQPRRDHVRVALEDERLAAGEVGFADGVSLVLGVRKALLASASTAHRPRAFHPRMSFKEAEAYLHACKLGQTEIGSYVLNVETPHAIDDQLATDPFGRRATVMLLRGVSRIATAVRQDQTSELLDAAHPIVSANLCEALVDMMPTDERADLHVAATWSPILPAPEVLSEVCIDRSMYESVERLGQMLRPAKVPTNATFIGRVAELAGEDGPDGVEGEVVLELPLEENVKAKVALSVEDYRQATAAHLGMRLVTVSGVLHRAGRKIAEIQEPKDFKIFES